MTRATRTLNPIHFEDLEPHRFEDLIRQLIYDYRDWASLEATGRGGADDGIDIRAYESVRPYAEKRDSPSDDDLDDLTPQPLSSSRLWIIQCKRERKITPKQLERYVQESLQGPEMPHGFILAAACDFSKKSYDAFRSALIGSGVQEFHLWGKSELEDMLFQPKNDPLLFAYFGISLQTRRRSRRTELRATLAWRKRIGKVLGGLTKIHNLDVLLRNQDAEEYPVLSDVPEFDRNPRWGIYRVITLNARNNLIFEVKRQLAYYDASTKHWDALPDALIPVRERHLYGRKRDSHDGQWERRQAWEQQVPEAQRAELVTVNIIPLERILAVDEEGDQAHPMPIFYIEPSASGRLIDDSDNRCHLEQRSQYGPRKEHQAVSEHRVPFFKDPSIEETPKTVT